ncbi:MAG: RNA 2',3'-cyclic phosphodiesterase [archaeon]
MNSKKDKTTRAFIALDFPDEVIKEIARLHPLINKQSFTGKLTELENLHLTLKFLGEIDNSRLTKVKTALSKISFPKFQAKLQEAGTFSYNKKPKIAWIKIGGKETYDLQKVIDNSLKDLLPKEERFMSHLTIARIKYTKDNQAFTDYIKKLSVKPIAFLITEFKLMSSELKPMGPVYETIESYGLKE